MLFIIRKKKFVEKFGKFKLRKKLSRGNVYCYFFCISLAHYSINCKIKNKTILLYIWNI